MSKVLSRNEDRLKLDVPTDLIPNNYKFSSFLFLDVSKAVPSNSQLNRLEFDQRQC